MVDEDRLADARDGPDERDSDHVRGEQPPDDPDGGFQAEDVYWVELAHDV